MKRFILLFILLMSVFTLHAQEKTGFISGKVSTAEGLAAGNVLVFIKGSNQLVYTSDAGMFRISSPQGARMLVFQSVTKKQVEIPVKVSGEEQEIPTVFLTENAYDLKEVVITGLSEPQSIRNSVYHIRTISSEMIRLRGATELKSILSNELGFRFFTDPMTGVSNPQLMGMSSSGIKILLDGVPMMDRSTEKESLGQVDINTVERIEIVEGPMSVIYGSDAMAGVINIITKKGGPDNLSVTARLQEETAGKEYDAFKDRGIHNEYLGVNWRHKGWSLGASGTRNNFGGWKGRQSGRAQEWLPKDQWLTAASVGYKNGKTDIWYRFNGADETIRLKGDYDPALTAPVAADKQYLSKRWFHQVQGSFLWNEKISIDAAASYTDYTRRTLSTNVDINTGKETLSTDLASQDKDALTTAFFRGILQYKLSSALTLRPGIEFNRNTGKGNRLSGEPDINDYSFFFSSQLQLTQNIEIIPGFRMVKNSVYEAPPFIPSLHGKIRLNKEMDFRFSYARGFRAPILRELYFYFKDANHDLSGNPNLKAETSNSFNASLAWTLKSSADLRINTVISGFFNDYHDKISLAVAENDERRNTYMNVDRYKTIGGEWTTAFFWKNLQASLGISYIGQYNQLSEDTETFGSSPEYTWSPELNTNVSYLIPKLGTNVGLFYKFSGKQPSYTNVTVDGIQKAELREISAYHMADLTLNKTINKYLTINAGARNLFDVTRLQTKGSAAGPHTGAGSNPFGFGRSYFLGLTMHWSKK